MVLKNCKIVNANSITYGDILIEKGIIKKIDKNIESDNYINMENKIVMPGGIDVHTHFDLDVGQVASDNFYTGTVAAACGGTTTIIDHIGFGPKGCELQHQINHYHNLAKNNAVIDYSFHGVIQHLDEKVLNDMEKLVKEGITSFKVYLTYDYKLSDSEVYRILKKAKQLGVIIAFHPENDDVINYLKSEFKKEKKLSPKYHPLSRPAECEAEAVGRVVLLSKMAGEAPIYIVHLSSKEALKKAVEGKKNQKNVYIETCPQYLLLDDSKYNDDLEGLKYIMSPPLRKKEDNEALMEALKEDIDVVATDHCPFFFETQKILGKDDFTKCPNGAPSVEARLGLVFSKGVMENKISLQKFVDICCTKPAKLFGLYPKKGVIQEGSDADIVVFDETKTFTLSKNHLHENVDYTPYEGIKIKGYPVMTISKGKIIAKNGEFLGKKGNGEFIKRSIGYNM